MAWNFQIFVVKTIGKFFENSDSQAAFISPLISGGSISTPHWCSDDIHFTLDICAVPKTSDSPWYLEGRWRVDIDPYRPFSRFWRPSFICFEKGVYDQNRTVVLIVISDEIVSQRFWEQKCVRYYFWKFKAVASDCDRYQDSNDTRWWMIITRWRLGKDVNFPWSGRG